MAQTLTPLASPSAAHPLRWAKRLLIAAAALLITLTAAPLTRTLDEQLADQLLPLTAADPPATITLIDIDEASLAAYGPWPWPRARLAQIATELRRLGARAQYWDLYLPDPKPGDEELAAALGPDVALGIVAVIDPAVTDPPAIGTLPAPLPSAGATPSPTCPPTAPVASGHLALAPTLAATPVAVGHLTPHFDPDGRLRRLPATLCVANRPLPPLFAAHPLPNPAYAARAQQTEPLRIPYRYPAERWRALSAAHLLTGQLPAGYLAGQTVLIGSTALGVADRVPTPLGPITPGLLVHAQLLADAAAGRAPLTELPLLPLVALTAAFALLPRRTLAAPLALLPLLAHPLLIPHGIWLPPLTPALPPLIAAAATFALRHLMLLQQRRQLADHLAALLPAPLATRLARTLPETAFTPDLIQQPRTLLLLTLRNLDRIEALATPQQLTLLLHAQLSTAQPIAARHAAHLYPAPHAGQLLLAWETPPTAATLAACATELHRSLSQTLPPLAPTDAPPPAPMLAITRGATLTGFIGPAKRRLPLLAGPALRQAQQLLELAPDYAAVVIATYTALAPDTPCPAPPAPFQPLAELLLPDEPHPTLCATLPLTDPLP